MHSYLCPVVAAMMKNSGPYGYFLLFTTVAADVSASESVSASEAYCPAFVLGSSSSEMDKRVFSRLSTSDPERASGSSIDPSMLAESMMLPLACGWFAHTAPPPIASNHAIPSKTSGYVNSHCSVVQHRVCMTLLYIIYSLSMIVALSY